MSTQIDFRTLPANVPVLCIPRVYPNISEGRIRKIFEELNMGVLDRIDMVSKSSDKGEKFNRVFIHFRRWNNSENSNTARERLLNGKEIKIIYDDPWFWKISAYREAERKPNTQQYSGARKPTLAFDSDEETSSRPAPTSISVRDERPRHDRPRDDRPRDDRPRDDRPRNDRPRNDRPRNERPRHDRPRDDRPRNVHPRDDRSRVDSIDSNPVERKFIMPRSPSSSPPRERPIEKVEEKVEEETLTVDYGNVPMPPARKRIIVPKSSAAEIKPLVIETEEGEVKADK